MNYRDSEWMEQLKALQLQRDKDAASRRSDGVEGIIRFIAEQESRRHRKPYAPPAPGTARSMMLAPAVAPQARRASTEPLVARDVAAYLEEWFQR